ncbi:MAG: hypothetical protein Tsb0016_20020 [Sphingomonadales bacterium]
MIARNQAKPKRAQPQAAAPGLPDDAAADGGLDRRWHLARDSHEVAVTELEYSLFRAFEAFSRWQSECLAAVSGKNLSGNDTAILHVIRMKDRPKSIVEIGRLLNRDDIANIQYSIRKLSQAGLIAKAGARGRRKGVRYQVTAEGVAVTQEYAMLRASLLMGLTKGVANMEGELNHGRRVLDLMTGIYEQAARVAVTHRAPFDD